MTFLFLEYDAVFRDLQVFVGEKGRFYGEKGKFFGWRKSAFTSPKRIKFTFLVG